MTDAGEKLRDRAMKFFPKTGGTPVDVMTDFCRAELERAAEIVDDCQCDRSAKCSCAEHAAAIRRRKE